MWNPETGKAMHKPLAGHSQFITAISWEPLHSFDNFAITIFDTMDSRLLVLESDPVPFFRITRSLFYPLLRRISLP